MPEISRFYGIVVRMFFNDHLPPHFRAEYGGEEVIIAIGNLASACSSSDPRVARRARARSSATKRGKDVVVRNSIPQMQLTFSSSVGVAGHVDKR